MATIDRALPSETAADLQVLAKRHLWMHFTRLGAYAEADVPIIVRGDGCYVWDEKGNRYFDGLSSLFCVNIGHGRQEVAQAGADQARELDFFTTWSYAHPRAIELAARIAGLAPGDLNRVFFTSGGGEAVETAIKLVRQYHKLTGNPTKHKVIAREIAYHGTSMGALAATGIPGLREPFEPFMPGGVHVPNTNLYRLPPHMAPEDLAETIAHAIEFEGPSTVAAVILEPVQNAGGCFVPPEGYFQRVREICDEYNVVFISDEVICSWGRLGEWFGCQRYDYQPDIITTAKGITSAYAPMGAAIVSDRIAEPFLEGRTSFLHGFTFGGHPISAAVAMANIDVFEREQLNEHVRANEGAFRSMLQSLSDIPIVGDVRGAGYFAGIELVKDRETKESFNAEESETLLRGFLSGELFRRGLICRSDDRGDPVIQLAPPLISTEEHFAEIESVLRPVLEEASREMELV
jgi:adenosylmethionine-8-amino-7-oxononanoate aminotransferase